MDWYGGTVFPTVFWYKLYLLLWSQLFLSTGIHNYYLMSFITYLVNVIFTIPGIMLIDVVGRRPLLFWGGVGMAISNFIIAICGVSINDSQINAILCVSFACVFIAFLQVHGVDPHGLFALIFMVYPLDKRLFL